MQYQSSNIKFDSGIKNNDVDLSNIEQAKYVAKINSNMIERETTTNTDVVELGDLVDKSTAEENKKISLGDPKHKSSAGIEYYNIIRDGFTPQGHAESENELIISACDRKFLNEKSDMSPYTTLPLYEIESEKKNSRLYIYDKNTHQYIGEIILPTKAHVGGATLDPEHNILYVTDTKGRVVAYDYDTIISTLRERSAEEENPVIDFSKGNVDSSKIQMKCDINIRELLGEDANASTCTFHDGSLYVATFDYGGALVKYDLVYNEDGSITTEGKIISDQLPAATQGICFYTDPVTGEEYLVTCQSYGPMNTCLKKYKIDENNNLEFVGQKELKDGFGQGIYCDEEGHITVIQEMENCLVNYVDIDDLNEDWDPVLEEKYETGVDIHKKDIGKISQKVAEKITKPSFDNPLAM